MNEIIERIPLDSIVPALGNRRIGGMDEAQLAELAESIKMIGVQQPAVVRAIAGPKPYELVAGERRWRASRLAGLDYLPCVVRDLTDAQAMHIRIVENLQREDIHPLDEADGFAELRETGGEDVEAIAREVGRSTVYVYQRLKLRELIPAARALLVAREITAGHANLIARLPAAQQEEVLKNMNRYRREIPSIRELDEWIRGELLMQLSGASWKLDDETLLPAAGACRTCPKRSGAAPELFGDMGKKDQCTDRECFQAKGQAMVARRREELKSEKIKAIEVLDGYVRHGNLPKGTLQNYQWSECKKSDPGAVRVLVVDGDHPGRLTWGKARGFAAAAIDPEEAKREKERKARAKKILAVAGAIQDELYRGIMAQADLAAGYREEHPELLALRRIAAKHIFDRAGWDACSAYMRREGIEPAKGWNRTAPVLEAIDSMDTRALDRFFLAIVFGGIPKPSEYSSRIPDTLEEGAAAIGLNVEEVVTRHAEAAGLTADEVNPPMPEPWRPGAEEDMDGPESGVCSVCGCSDEDACNDDGQPCHWVNEEHTLCSACEKKTASGAEGDLEEGGCP